MSVRFGVIADVHGNLEGLQAVLGKLRRLGVEELLCLGDVVGYGSDPDPCWVLVKNACSVVLSGNHEAMLSGKMDDSHCSALGRQSAMWTSAHVSSAVGRELAALPFRADRYGASFFHSAPRDDGSWPYLNQPSQILDAFRGEPSPLLFYGHTHRPRVTLVDQAGEIVRDELIQATARYQVDLQKYRCYVNPGSAGQQRDAHTDVSFAVCELEDHTALVQVFRIPYRRLRAYRKLLDFGCGKAAADYLIREKGRRRFFELLDHRRGRLSGRTSGK